MTVAVPQEPNKHHVQTHDMRVLPVVNVNRGSIRVTRRNEGVLPPQSIRNTIPPGDIEDPGNARADFPNASEERNLRNISRHSRVLFNAFMVRKASGGWRPVIDLKQLNHHIYAPHFRMHTISSVLSTVKKRRLRIQNRSAGCVLSCINTSTQQEVPSFCLRKQGISVSSTSLQSEHCPSGIYLPKM